MKLVASGKTALLLVLFAGCRAPAVQQDTGCGGTVQDPLAEVVVADARLEDVTLWQAGLGVGHAEGSATLIVDDTDGEEHDFEARLDGTHYGLLADASADDTFGVAYPLTVPAGTVLNARQLLGTYQGPHVGIDIGIGGHWRNLQNDAGVALNVTSLSFGLGFVPATWETLDLELWDDPREVVDANDTATGVCTTDADCGADEICDGGTCFADVAECAARDEGCTVDATLNGPGDCCDANDVCVPSDPDGFDDASSTAGVCRQACGTLQIADGVVDEAKDASITCDVGTCQTVTTAPYAAVVAVACIAPGQARNDACHAMFDDVACPAGLDCRPTEGFTDTDGTTSYLSFACRLACDPSEPASVDVCTAAGEACMPSSMQVPDEPAQYDCAVPVPATFASSPPDDASLVCDDVTGSRYCDDAVFAGSANPGVDICISAGATDAFCAPLCSVPAFDFDGDGVITAGVDQEHEDFDCGAGFACDFKLALTHRLTAPLTDATGAGIPCSCGAGVACPNDCHADAICDDDATTPRCVAAYGTCEPVP